MRQSIRTMRTVTEQIAVSRRSLCRAAFKLRSDLISISTISDDFSSKRVWCACRRSFSGKWVRLFVKNIIARLFFNLTHVVTRSVSLILLKSGFVAYQLKHLIGFCYNASYIWRIRERGHAVTVIWVWARDISLKNHPPDIILSAKRAVFPITRRSYAFHHCFIRFLRILSVGSRRTAAFSSSAPCALSRPASFPTTAVLHKTGSFPRLGC